MNGNTILEADVGDTVQMISEDGEVGDVFEIYEDNSGNFVINIINWIFDVDDGDEIRTGLNNISGVIKSNGDLVGLWTITEPDLSNTVGDYDGFGFIVDGDTSGPLKVLPDYDDEELNVSIVSPRCGISFNESTLHPIAVFADDSDDEIIGKMTIGGVEVGTFGNDGIVRNSTGDFDIYNFTVPGNVQVIIEVNNTRGVKSKSTSSLMVLDVPHIEEKKYVAPCINEPVNYASFEESRVEFNASESRAIEIIDDKPSVIFPGSGRLKWYWTFSPEGEKRTFDGVAPNGDGTSLLAYEFIAEFPIAGENSAKLELKLD
jgi:hypothetical protein